MFCPKCGSLLTPKIVDGKKVMSCSCGYSGSGELTFKEEKKEEKELEVIDPTKEDETQLVVEQECPKCGHKKAVFWEVQTRAGDEPATKFYRCKQCNHTWRDYS